MQSPLKQFSSISAIILDFLIALGGCNSNQTNFQTILDGIRNEKLNTTWQHSSLLPTNGQWQLRLPDSTRVLLAPEADYKIQINNSEPSNRSLDTNAIRETIDACKRASLLGFDSNEGFGTFTLYLNTRSIDNSTLPRYLMPEKELNSSGATHRVGVLEYAQDTVRYAASATFQYYHPINLGDGWYYYETMFHRDHIPQAFR